MPAVNEQAVTPRLARRIQRELAWLRNMGIERDHSVPLYPNQKPSSGRYNP